MDLIAITRQVSSQIGSCELTHMQRQPINYTLAREQHHAYEQALNSFGLQVISLLPENDLPDSVFVEDTALVLDELAVLMRPGAQSRRREVLSVAQALQPYRQLNYIQAPATIDGGDILVVGKKVYVGLSSRSNHAAVSQLSGLLQPYGYSVIPIAVSGCLHLKSAVTLVAEAAVLLNPVWIERQFFSDYSIITVDPNEPYGANALLGPGGVMYPAGFPATAERLRRFGLEVIALDVSELMKAEGAVTCCSLIFRYN